jgi:hypothetical protein
MEKIKFNLISLFTILLLLTESAFSQSISFSGIDKAIGKAVVMDSVVIKNLTNGRNYILKNGDTSVLLGSISAIKEGTVSDEFQLLVKSLFRDGSCPFELSVGASCQVNIRIFDIFGKSIASISNYLSSGIHRFEFCCSGLAGGVYFINAENGRDCKTAKIVVLSSGSCPVEQGINYLGSYATSIITSGADEFDFDGYSGKYKVVQLKNKKPQGGENYLFEFLGDYDYGLFISDSLRLFRYSVDFDTKEVVKQASYELPDIKLITHNSKYVFVLTKDSVLHQFDYWLKEIRKIELKTTIAIKANEDNLYSATDGDFYAFDMQLKNVGNVDLLLKNKKNAHDIMLNGNIAYLLDNIVEPIIVFQVDISKPEAMNIMYFDTILSLRTGHLSSQFLSDDTWYVVESNFPGESLYQETYKYGIFGGASDKILNNITKKTSQLTFLRSRDASQHFKRWGYMIQKITQKPPFYTIIINNDPAFAPDSVYLARLVKNEDTLAFDSKYYLGEIFDLEDRYNESLPIIDDGFFCERFINEIVCIKTYERQKRICFFSYDNEFVPLFTKDFDDDSHEINCIDLIQNLK